MNKILDLQAVLSTDTLDIKLLDESIVHLRKPTFRDYAVLQQFLQNIDKADESIVYTFVLFILNTNIDNRTFESADIEGFNQTIILAIINAYVGFTQDITTNPFTTRQPSPQAKKAAQKKQ